MLRTLLVFTLEQWKKYKVIAYLKGMQNGVIQIPVSASIMKCCNNQCRGYIEFLTYCQRNQMILIWLQICDLHAQISGMLPFGTMFITCQNFKVIKQVCFYCFNATTVNLYEMFVICGFLSLHWIQWAPVVYCKAIVLYKPPSKS